MTVIKLPEMKESETRELETYRSHALSVGEEATLVARAIHDAATAEAAAQWCSAKLGWCERIKDKEGFLGKMRDLAHQAHKLAVKQIGDLIDPVESAVSVVKDSIRTWRAAESKRIAEAQAIIYAEAKRKDEEERLKAAEKLEASGNTTMANAVLAQAGNFVAPVVEMAKSKTLSGRKIWKIRYDESKKGELLKMIAERPDLYPFVTINEKMIEKQAALMDGNLKWPGVVCYEDEILAIKKA